MAVSVNYELKADKIVYTAKDSTVIATATYQSRNNYKVEFDKDIALQHFGKGLSQTVESVPYEGLEYVVLAGAVFYEMREN